LAILLRGVCKKTVIVLRYYEDLSDAYTARVLNCSAGAVTLAVAGLTRPAFASAA
jgi:hypothetical protein